MCARERDGRRLTEIGLMVGKAKLGEKNKFYYDEKLKRWIEAGIEPLTEEATLPPPPTTASKSSPTNEGQETKSSSSSEHSSGLPPIPPTVNQFSARGRLGIRSRYVDTFNKGGGTPTNLFHSPSVPAAKLGGGTKFFVPAPIASIDQAVDATGENTHEVAAATSENPSTSDTKESFSSSSESNPSLQRFPSMNNIANNGVGMSHNGTGPFISHSRAASWSGGYSDIFNPKSSEVKPLGEALGMPLSSFMMPSDPSSTRPSNRSCSGDDLHEVEL